MHMFYHVMFHVNQPYSLLQEIIKYLFLTNMFVGKVLISFGNSES